MKSSTILTLPMTAGLVALWGGGEAARSDAGRRLMRRLDCAASLPLRARCDAVWPDYREVILNRKGLIADRALDFARQPEVQAVLLGAGMTPLGIDLAALTSARVFEIDLEFMPAKAALARELAPELADRLHFLGADITEPAALRPLLDAAGWSATRPTCVIGEGISYYLPGTYMRDLAAAFGSPGNRLVWEYLLPGAALSRRDTAIAERVFGVIQEACGLPALMRYSREQVREAFGAARLFSWSLADMERSRTGRNLYFDEFNPGWIGITEAQY